jgi:hypothetical protein
MNNLGQVAKSTEKHVLVRTARQQDAGEKQYDGH